jgi:hypothetical protein
MNYKQVDEEYKDFSSVCDECGLPYDICAMASYAELAIKGIKKIDYHKMIKSFLHSQLDKALQDKIRRVEELKYDNEHKFLEAYWWTRGDDVTRPHAYKEAYDDILSILEETT